MGKKFDKTVKNNAVTYIMVIVAWLVMMALQQAGMLNSSTTGLLVPVCIYSIMAVSLNRCSGGGRVWSADRYSGSPLKR